MIVAIDPGKTGAIAILTNIGQLVTVADMPVAGGNVSPQLFGPLTAPHYDPTSTEPNVAVIEQVHAMPGQGVSSMFTFGRSVGVVEGVLATQGWRIVWVTPGRWKKTLGLSADKDQSRRRAIELWPQHAGLFARKKDDGRAEAALIGHWWTLQ